MARRGTGEVLVEVDSRGRLALGRIGVEPGSHWMARRRGDQVVLSPVAVVPAHEAAFRADPKRAELLDGPWPELPDVTEEFDRLARKAGLDE